MKKFLVLLCASLLMLGSFSVAGATVIGFDDLTSGYYSSVYTNGVTITDLMGGDLKVLSNNNEGVGYSSEYMSVAPSQWTVGYGLVFTFDTLVDNISLTGGDEGGDTDGFSLEAFDSDMNSLGFVQTGAFTGADPVNPIVGTSYGDYRTLSLDVTGIKKLIVKQTYWGQSYDDLTFDGAVVPEPATFLLFGLGILGIAGVSRKKTA